MNLDLLTLIIALWGALISTILGIRELRKDRRSLKIILESVNWVETFRILITNTAERPITITEINLSIDDKTGGGEDLIRPGVYWEEEYHQPPALPLKLNDGELAIFWISQIVSSSIRESRSKRLLIKVYDAEGRVYSKYSQGHYDPKWEYRSGRYKPPNIFAQLKWKFLNWYYQRKNKN
jgi:hypothetical protein